MVPDDDDWRKDELKRVNVCVCVCVSLCVCVRERERNRQTEKAKSQTDKEARQPPTEAVGIPEQRNYFLWRCFVSDSEFYCLLVTGGRAPLKINLPDGEPGAPPKPDHASVSPLTTSSRSNPAGVGEGALWLESTVSESICLWPSISGYSVVETQ